LALSPSQRRERRDDGSRGGSQNRFRRTLDRCLRRPGLLRLLDQLPSSISKPGSSWTSRQRPRTEPRRSTRPGRWSTALRSDCGCEALRNRDEFLLAATAQNLRRMAKWLMWGLAGASQRQREPQRPLDRTSPRSSASLESRLTASARREFFNGIGRYASIEAPPY
jgi:hypothetical protein